MTDLSSLLSNLPPGIANVISQVTAGNHAAVPDAEAQQAYSHVTGQLSQDEFQQVAANAYQQMTPEQRGQVADYLRTQGGQLGTTAPSVPTAAEAAADPNALATATAQVHGQSPNLLQQMFAPGGTFSSPIAKMALLGVTAFAAQRLTGRR
jgi:hypothetical protein